LNVNRVSDGNGQFLKLGMLMHHTHTSKPAPQSPALREQLSALMDGECSSQEAAELTQALAQSGQWPQTWHDFEAVGAALRIHAQTALTPTLTQPSVFVQGVMARLQSEAHEAPAVLERSAATAAVVALPPVLAANDGVFRWKLVASVATMAAVLSVAWQLGGGVVPADAQIATAPEAAAPALPANAWQQVQTVQGTMLRDAELEALMAAHRQHGGMTALQMPAGFLRTATFDPSVR
jgi:sigma-E factor negative regulatory protein RseA